MKEKKQDSDVIIVGGGPVGSLMAVFSASHGFRTILIDQVDPTSTLTDEFDGRTTSIAYGSTCILEEAGVWKLLISKAHPIHRIIVSDYQEAGQLDYFSNDVGDHPLGYMVENRYLRKALYARTQALKDALQWIAPAKIKTLEQGEFKSKLILESGAVLEAPLVIAADGKTSMLRSYAGIEVRKWAYDQSCLVFVAEHSLSHDDTAYERFHPNGPLATLPLDNQCSAIVWTDTPDLAQALYGLPEAEFNLKLNKRFGERLGRIHLKGQRWVYPLSGGLARTLVSQRLALIGDAGHSIHPVAGQGMNLGIRDVKSLSDLLLKAKSLGGDIGSQTLLSQYDKARKVDNASMAGMTHGLVRLFSNDYITLRKIRSLGLGLVSKLPRTKKALTRHAMGL